MGDILEGIRVIDVDSHVSEPPDLWTSRLPKKWGDSIPHVKFDPNVGMDAWFIRDRLAYIAAGGTAAAGWRDFVPPGPKHFDEVTPGAWDPKARLQWMDENRLYGQVLYSNVLGFAGMNFLPLEPELRLLCVQAYNDFLAEFASADPDRLIPLANLPWWDVDASLAELERCHAIGHKGLNFGWQFEKAGLPPLVSDHWEPLLRTVEEMGWSVSFHLGMNSRTEEDTLNVFENVKQSTLKFVRQSALMYTSNFVCIAELILGGICEKYPTLKFVSVESGAGYLPFLLDAMDWQFTNTRAHRDFPGMMVPSEYFRRQIYGTFWFEKNVAQCIELYADNLMFETDYPHATSLAAGENTRARGPEATIQSHLATVAPDKRRKVLEDNARLVYGLT